MEDINSDMIVMKKSDNFTEIYKFFKSEYSLNQDGLEELFSLFEIKKHKKGSLLIQSQAKEKQLRFLNKGMVREYYSNHKKEININFYVKPQFISDLLTFSQDSYTNKNQECLSSVEVLSIDKKPFFDLLEKYQCGKSIIETSFQRLLKQKEILEFNRMTKTPEELYKELFIYKPD